MKKITFFLFLITFGITKSFSQLRWVEVFYDGFQKYHDYKPNPNDPWGPQYEVNDLGYWDTGKWDKWANCKNLEWNAPIWYNKTDANGNPVNLATDYDGNLIHDPNAPDVYSYPGYGPDRLQIWCHKYNTTEPAIPWEPNQKVMCSYPVWDWAANPPMQHITETNKYFRPYLSGSMWYIQPFAEGFFQVNAKIPLGRGFWPAFWLYKSPAETNSSKFYEIDLFEAHGNSTKFSSTVHTATSWNFNKKLQASTDQVQIDSYYGYNTYGALWKKPVFAYDKFFYKFGEKEIVRNFEVTDEIVFYHNSKPLKHEIKSSPVSSYYIHTFFGHDFHKMNMVANFAMDGDGGWSGIPDPNNNNITPMPSYLGINYVRVVKFIDCSETKYLCKNQFSTHSTKDSREHTVYVAGTIKVGAYPGSGCTKPHPVIIRGPDWNVGRYKPEFLHLHATNSITIGPGFHAQSGCDFLAKMHNCNDLPIVTYSSSKNDSEQVVVPPPPHCVFEGNCDSVQMKKAETIEQDNSMEIEENDKSVKIFPNPTKDIFQILVKDKIAEIKNVKISDQYGKIIYNKANFENGEEIDLSSFATGIYNLIFVLDGKVITKKIIKQ